MERVCVAVYDLSCCPQFSANEAYKRVENARMDAWQKQERPNQKRKILESCKFGRLYDEKRRLECCKGDNTNEGWREETSKKTHIEMGG